MPAVARIESTLAFNDVAFTQGIERAEKRAQTFAGRVESQFNSLFRKAPGRRAEKALTGLIGDISTGSLSQGIISFANRLTGLGLAAGVGVGVAIELFSKLHDSVKEVRVAHDQLDRQMSKPLNLTSIEGLGAAIDNLRGKQDTFTHSFTNYLYDIAHQKGAMGLLDLGKAGMAEEEEISAAIAKRQAAEKLRGRTELVQANVLASLGDDPKRKALAELRFKFEERRNTLMASPDKGTEMRLKALDVEQEQAEKNFRLGKSNRAEEFEDARKMLVLKRMNLSPDIEKQAAASLTLEGVNRQLKSKNLSPEERDKLLLQKFSAETEIQQLKPKEARNPFAFGTIANRDFADQGFGSIAARTKAENDSSVYGSLGYNAAQRGDVPEKATDSMSVVEVLRQLLAFEQKVWGAA